MSVNQQDVVQLHRKDPNLTAGQIAERLRCRPEYVRSTAARLKLTLPGALVPAAKYGALLDAMSRIRDGLADTGSKPGEWMTQITKRQAHDMADAAIKAAGSSR